MTDTYNPLARPEAVVQAQRDAWDGTERRLPENVELRMAYDVIHHLPLIPSPCLQIVPRVSNNRQEKYLADRNT
jgi:hypothetical protein